MPSRPPETKFYDDAENVELWRSVTRLYEDFCGPDSEKWSEREDRFVIILNDVRSRVRETPRKAQV